MARFKNGWIKLHRKAEQCDLGDNVILWALWTHLLTIANWKESKILWEGKLITVPIGSAIIGVKQIANRWKISRSVISKWLNFLQKRGSIVLTTCPRGSLVTICNWELYQNDEVDDNIQRGNSVETACEQRVNNEALIEESKNIRKKEINNIVGIRTDYPQEFDDFWESYGRRGDKKKAFVEFKKLKLLSGDLDDLRIAIKNYCKATPDPQYRKHFHRFLQTDWRECVNPIPVSSSLDWNYIFGGEK